MKAHVHAAWDAWIIWITCTCDTMHMGWLRLVGSFKSYVSFVKEPYKKDNNLQKSPTI